MCKIMILIFHFVPNTMRGSVKKKKKKVKHAPPSGIIFFIRINKTYSEANEKGPYKSLER